MTGLSAAAAAVTVGAPRATIDPKLLRGLLVGLVAASIGALYTVFARWGIARGMDSTDMTFLRFGVAGVVTLPVLALALRRDARGFFARWRAWLAVSLLAGPLFGLLMFTALQWAPASHAAVFPFTAMSVMGTLMMLLFFVAAWDFEFGVVNQHLTYAVVTAFIGYIGAGHFYVSQSDKGGLVFGGDLDGYNSYAQRGNLPTVEHVITEGKALIPAIARVRLVRSWGGIMDMSMDGTPIIAKTPIPGLYLNTGWCYGGFKATPASGWCFAHTIAKDEPHPLSAKFTLERFRRGVQIDDKGQGPVPGWH